MVAGQQSPSPGTSHPGSSLLSLTPYLFHTAALLQRRATKNSDRMLIPVPGHKWGPKVLHVIPCLSLVAGFGTHKTTSSQWTVTAVPDGLMIPVLTWDGFLCDSLGFLRNGCW